MKTTKNIPSKGFSFAFLRPRGEKPHLVAATLGLFLGLFGTLFSLTFLTILQRFLPIARWGNSAASGLTDIGPIALFLVAVLFAPAFETFVGQAVPIEVARRFCANRFVCVILGGAVFGLGHFLNGGLVHGISTFFGGIVFSFGYVTLRWAGVFPAFIAASTAHAVQNATLLFIIAPLFPEMA
jgi:hypothetical protein